MDDTRTGLSRDRSRSLKVLTDRLLNKNSKQAVPEMLKADEEAECKDDISRTVESGDYDPCELHITQTIPGAGLPPGTCSRRSPDRHSMDHTYDKIMESPEDVEQEETEGTKSASSDESFRTVPEFSQDDSQMVHEKSPDSDYPHGSHDILYDSDGGGSSRSQDDYIKMKSSIDKTADDEGISEVGEHGSPVVSTYIYHPIPRNSKFLQLAATKPPKRYPPERRSGITMLATRGQVGGISKSRDDSKEGQSPESQSRQKFQRRSDSGRSGTQKSSPRFTTHPPHMKPSHSEDGSVDTNGFATLKSAAESDDEHKQSQLSLVDSQFASEMSDDSSYQDAVESIVTDIEIADHKNGKSSKQKSISDPSGDRARDVLDFSHGIENPQSLSAPLLSKEKIKAISMEKNVLASEEEKQKSFSENTLVLPYSMHDDTEEGHSSAGEDDDGAEAEQKGSERSTPDSETVLNPNLKYPSSPAMSHAAAPQAALPSPVSSSDRPASLLSVPMHLGSGRKSNIFRSASSASVFQSRKPTGSPLRDKDVVRKYSITSDEAMTNSKSSANLVPEFLPIGDTGNASSMPAVWNKDRISCSADSPEREPGFIKVKLFCQSCFLLLLTI